MANEKQQHIRISLLLRKKKMKQSNEKTISVIGLGVVGLTTTVGFRLKGYQVTGIDIDTEKVIKINEGISPIYESDLPPVVIPLLKSQSE